MGDHITRVDDAGLTPGDRPEWVGIAIRWPDGRVQAVEFNGEDLDLRECVWRMDAEVDRPEDFGMVARARMINRLFRFTVAARRFRIWLAGANAAQPRAAITAEGERRDLAGQHRDAVVPGSERAIEPRDLPAAVNLAVRMRVLPCRDDVHGPHPVGRFTCPGVAGGDS